MSPFSTSSLFGLLGGKKNTQYVITAEDLFKGLTELDFAHMEICKCHIAILTHGMVTFKNIMTYWALSHGFHLSQVSKTCKYMYNYMLPPAFWLSLSVWVKTTSQKISVSMKSSKMKNDESLFWYSITFCHPLYANSAPIVCLWIERIVRDLILFHWAYSIFVLTTNHSWHEHQLIV